jgi:fatty acyl-CoA reductase
MSGTGTDATSAAEPGDTLGRAAAFFDFDGTIVRTNIVHCYAYLRRRELSAAAYVPWAAWFLVRGLFFKLMDRIDRHAFSRVFYKSYRNLNEETLKGHAPAMFEELLKPNIAAEAVAAVEAHRAAGRELVLLSGSLDFIVQPLADHLNFDRVVASHMQTKDGKFTGVLDGASVVGQEKRVRVLDDAEKNGIDLAASFAYADSISDLPILEAVGNPVVINPDARLEHTATVRGWPIEKWTTFAGPKPGYFRS